MISENKTPIRNREILNCFRAGLIVIDKDRNILYVNDIGRRILGLPHGKMKASSRDHFFKVLISSFDSEYLPSRIEIDIERKDTRVKQVIGITLSEIKKGGERKAIVAFFKDLSAIEKVSEVEGLKSRLLLLGQMAAGMAHGIRNPLASIKIHAELLKKKAKSPGLDPLIDSVLKDIEKVDNIVQESLNFVKHEAVNRKPVKLLKLLNDIVRSAERINSKASFHLLPGEIGPNVEVWVDKKLFSQAIYNIVQNAAESYEGKRGDIYISGMIIEEFSDILKLSDSGDLKKKLGKQKKSYLYLNIKDNGPGLKPDIREKIFTPFVTTKKKGIGIGLPISQKIIHSHDGIIDVISSESKGTEFRIKIPVE